MGISRRAVGPSNSSQSPVDLCRKGNPERFLPSSCPPQPPAKPSKPVNPALLLLAVIMGIEHLLPNLCAHTTGPLGLSQRWLTTPRSSDDRMSISISPAEPSFVHRTMPRHSSPFGS